ncbi:hypothetical protein J7E62_26785 [Variovorax paradoxus]|nr:hypothetical protein [Variovorax paradoxus]
MSNWVGLPVAPGVTTVTVRARVTASNAGPSAANGAVLRDSHDTGVDCTGAGLAPMTCSASAGATCPATLSASGLISQGGLAIPAFPAGSQLILTMQCKVLATGMVP